MRTRRKFLATVSGLPALSLLAPFFATIIPIPARAQVVEGIGLLLSAYQAFGKKGGDGGLSAILKNTLEKLDQIHKGMNLLSEKLDSVISMIGSSTDAIITEIQRSEMRGFTSSILSQVRRYEVLQPLMATSGIEGMKTYNEGREIRGIRDETYISLMNMFSVERTSMIQPLDLVTTTLGLGLFALTDTIIGNDPLVRGRAISMISEAILRAGTLDGRNGASLYLASVEQRIARSANSMLMARNWPAWAIKGINPLLRPKIDRIEGSPLVYRYFTAQAVWIARRWDSSEKECETRTRTKGSIKHGADYEENYEYCYQVPTRSVHIFGYSLARTFRKSNRFSFYQDPVGIIADKIDLKEHAPAMPVDLVLAHRINLSVYSHRPNTVRATPMALSSDAQTSAYQFQKMLAQGVAITGDSVESPNGLSWTPLNRQGATYFPEFSASSSDWLQHAALLQIVVDALTMLNDTHAALVVEE